MKMLMIGYPDILTLNFKEDSLDKVYTCLQEAKNKYILMDRRNFLEMYPVLKKLFFYYTNFVECYIKAANNNYKIQLPPTYTDEGKNLPGDVIEMKSWFKELNKWFLIKRNNIWITCVTPFIATSDGFNESLQELQKITKFRNFRQIKDDNADESYIREDRNKILFGFVNMERAKVEKVPKNAVLFYDPCPQKCTPDSRNWICNKCGEYAKTSTNPTGAKFLHCSCGSKKHEDIVFSCYHLIHKLENTKIDTSKPKTLVLHC